MVKLEGLQKEIWEKKYRYDGEPNIEATWRRVAKAVASVEESDREHWEEAFYQIQNDFKFIPGGRITAGAGTKNNYLLNCCVIGIENDSIDGIYEAIKKCAVLAKSNYGTGIDFSTVRPKNSLVSKGGTASGPVSFMKVFDSSGAIIETGGGRRAAAIGVLRVDHPDIFEFIAAKREQGVLTQFNISVGITQKFLDAVRDDSDFDLVFNGKVYQTVKAKDIWKKLTESAWLYNDPGLLFIDEVNKYNNGWYLYDIGSTNPCGEIPLPENGVCCLGNINLTQFIKTPFSQASTDWQDNFDFEAYETTIHTAVRFLDNVLDVSEYPYEEMRLRAQHDRRIGLCGAAGLGSALAMLRIPYDSPEALQVADTLQEFATHTAYTASVRLAQDKGSFYNFDKEHYGAGEFIHKLDGRLQEAIRHYGIRNIALLTIPPVGTGSLLAGNISNGLEPIFALEYNRNVRQSDNSIKQEAVEDYAWGLFKASKEGYKDTPEFFKTSREIHPTDHVKMQAVLQNWIDGSISKTANLPESFSLKEYEELLLFAVNSGIKGFTSFREGTREGVLETKKEDKPKEESVDTGKLSGKDVKKKRARVLSGKTYKISDGKGNIYCTINDITEKGKTRPFEIFISSNGENNEFMEWYQLTAKNWSAIMRRVSSPEELRFVCEDAKSIYAPSGYFSDGKYVNSKPQMLGLILEEHIDNLINPEKKKETLSKCPECGEISYSKEGGCGGCKSCGYSKCG